MKFGIDYFPDVHPDRVSGQQYFADVLDLAEEADRLGYDSVKIVEHYFTSYGGYSPDPCVFLAACSQRTRRLRMVTGAVLPVFNHPLKLAGQLTMLDAISGGRLDAGFARAFMPYEFDAFGISMDESRARFEEGIEAITRLWTEETVTFEGKFHRFKNVTSLPRPTQQPHPPIWVAAVVTPESFVWTGARGYSRMVVPYLGEHHELAEKLQLYRQAYRDHGHEARKGPGEVMMVLHLFVAPTRKEAREECQPYMEQYLRNFRRSAKAWTGRQSGQYKPYSAGADAQRHHLRARARRDARDHRRPRRRRAPAHLHPRDLRRRLPDLPDQLRHDGKAEGAPEHGAVRPPRHAALPLRCRHLRWRRGVPGIIGRTAAAGHRWTDAGRAAAPR